MKKLLPAVLLFFLAPAIAELLSGSAPPVEFFNPVGFVLLVALYGSGAILARELTLRWRKGWPSLFLLGAAYAIVEEGLMVKSFFDPNWVDLGILGFYGRWAGINWVWAVELTIFHAVISIAIPILLVELIFPKRRGESWIGRRAFSAFSVVLVMDTLLGHFFMTAYRPSFVHSILTVLVVIALALLAWKLPQGLFVGKTVRVPRPVWFWLVGFLGTVAFFLVFWGLPNTNLHPFTNVVIGIGLVALIVWVVMRLCGNGMAWGDIHKLALAAGPLSLFILLSPIQEFDPKRTDNTAGMTLVGVAALAFLLWLWWRVRASRQEVSDARGITQ